MNPRAEYSRLFAMLGLPLSKRDAIPAAKLAKAKSKLGIRLPRTLRDYYQVAGREKILNHSFNRLCSPGNWELHSGRLIFMEENQTVVVWGISISKSRAQDPMVFQCPLVDGELDKWYSVRTRCSGFLKFMIQLQAAYGGGLPFTASAPVTKDPSARLNSSWLPGGEVHGMRAYSTQNRVVCVAKWRDCGSNKRAWRVFGGAKTEDELAAIAKELGINWDS